MIVESFVGVPSAMDILIGVRGETLAAGEFNLFRTGDAIASAAFEGAVDSPTIPPLPIICIWIWVNLFLYDSIGAKDYQ
jgi:hypothetical protein